MFSSEKANDIKNDAKRVKEDAVRVKDEAFNYAKNNSSDAIHQARDTAREAGKNVYDFFKSNRQRLIDAEETASRRIKNRPLTSAAAIFGTGVILGSIFTRSRRLVRNDRRDY